METPGDISEIIQKNVASAPLLREELTDSTTDRFIRKEKAKGNKEMEKRLQETTNSARSTAF